MADTVIKDGIEVRGQASFDTAFVSNAHLLPNAGIERSKMAQNQLDVFTVDWAAFRVHDAYATPLPATSAADDLGLYGGTFATDSPAIRSYDVKAAGAVTLYARFPVVLPANYEDAQSVTIRMHCGMLTTVSDGTATIDLEVYRSDKGAGIGSDLCSTAAQTINSVTFADKDFVITSVTLLAGDLLDCRMTMAIDDTATVTVVQGCVGLVSRLCDTRG